MLEIHVAMTSRGQQKYCYHTSQNETGSENTTIHFVNGNITFMEIQLK